LKTKRYGFFGVVLLSLLSLGCKSITTVRTKTALPEKSVILTFDDGPGGETTMRLLDVLQAADVKAAFALLGENAARYPELVRRIAEEGHLIINHGWSDAFAFRMGEAAFTENLERGEEAINSALANGGFFPLLYRPQGGYYTAAQEKIWKDKGYTLVPATIRIYDAAMTASSARDAVSKVIAKTEKEKGGIILLHDARDSWKNNPGGGSPGGHYDRSWIPQTVADIIAVLREKGYYFEDPKQFFGDAAP
jgi:peptidoglycan/xylan/chitin deacetylase (PgdA/CDA1 family)